MIALKSEDTPTQQAAVARILAAPHKYPPIVFCAMADLLFNKGKVDEASFWFYAGMLRIRFDAKRCADLSAREAVAAIDRQYGRNISRYAAQDPKNFEALISRAVAWDRETPHDYDHRWINLYGMNAMLPSMAGASAEAKPQPMSLPKDQWDELAEKNRLQYIGDIRGALKNADSAASNATAQAR
jgi:hypothetical protein